MDKELPALEANGIDYKGYQSSLLVGLIAEGRLFISDRAHVVLDLHKQIDGLNEEALGEGQKIGTTKNGIGPCYSDKMSRTGIRVCDLNNMELFRQKVTSLVQSTKKRFPSFEYDIDAEVSK